MPISISFHEKGPYDYAVKDHSLELPSFVTVRIHTSSGEVTFFMDKDNLFTFEHTLTRILEELRTIREEK